MSDQKMQECFEFFYDLKWEQVNDFAQQAWKAAWLASRECLVIELPIIQECCSDGGESSKWMAPEDVIKSIHAAGVKYK
ncbi:MAG: hypothetical protein J6D44_06910 [Pseudomonas sp.]|nr:hypothetical protein [Pseudomonas sp.]